MSDIVQQKHRLPREMYRGRIVAAFTMCVHKRASLFRKEDVFKAMEETLLRSLAMHYCEAHIYLCMPDHVHLLLEGKSEQSDLWRCVVDFKQRSGYWLSRNGFKEKWQKDFFDHLMRKDEDVVKHVKYILGNPVRKGLTDDWKNYPFKGSTVYNFATWE